MSDREKYELALAALMDLEPLEGDRVLPMINYLRERAQATDQEGGISPDEIKANPHH